MTIEQHSYSWGHRRTPADIKHPTSLAALVSLVQAATTASPMLIRAGENALDVQALTRGVSVRTDQLPTDVTDPAIFRVWDDDDGGPGPGGTPSSKLMRVAAWLPWRAITAAAVAEGVLPYVTVSSGRITPGGSLAGDGLSRFSPTIDKEAHHVYEIEAVFPAWSNRITTIRHPDYFDAGRPIHPDVDEATNRDLFYAMIGGHGLIGVMTAVTYWVMSLPDGWRDITRLRVRSFVTRYDEHTEFFSDLLGQFYAARANRTLSPARPVPVAGGHSFPARPDDGYVAIFGAGALNVHGRARSPGHEHMTIWRSELDYDVPVDAFTGFSSKSRGQLKFVMRLLPAGRSAISALIWEMQTTRSVARAEQLKDPWVDEFEAFTYFFEEHTHAVEELMASGAKVRPFKPGALQQTFAFPTDTANADRFLDYVVAELNRAVPRIRGAGVVPQVTDCLFLPQHETVLAPNPDGDAFALTLGCEGLGNDPQYAASARKAMECVARVCHVLGGRVHLTKNIYVDDETLGAMYGPQFAEFARIKAIADPNTVLVSDLWERIERVLP